MMLLRRRLALASAGLLLLALAAPAAGKKASLFDRILAATTGGKRNAQGLSDVLVTGEVPDEFISAAPKVDAWKVDGDLQILSRMMEADHMNILSEMVNLEGMKEIWTSPKAVKRILEGMPMLEGIRGVPEIMAKAEVTSQDGEYILGALQKLTMAYTNKMKEMGTTDGLQGLFSKYQNSEDPTIKGLFAAISDDAPGTEAEKAQKSKKLQQLIADDVWGGLIDLDKFGLNGEVPRSITEVRDRVIEEQPDVWELMTLSDPLVKAILQNPFKAAEIAADAFGVDKVSVPGYEGPIGP